MVVTQKITRPTAILSKHDSKREKMREWVFIANYTLRSFRSQAFKTQKNTVIICFDLKKGVAIGSG